MPDSTAETDTLPWQYMIGRRTMTSTSDFQLTEQAPAHRLNTPSQPWPVAPPVGERFVRETAAH